MTNQPQPEPCLDLYAFDNEQSARIEQYRYALSAIADLADGAIEHMQLPLEGERRHMAQLFEYLAWSLGEIIGPHKVMALRLDPDGRRWKIL